MRCFALLLALGGLLAAVPAAAAPTGVARCHRAVNDTVSISSARNMTCRAAARDFSRYRRSIYRTFRTPGGFRCTRVSGDRLGGEWRCAKGRRAYRFVFGD